MLRLPALHASGMLLLGAAAVAWAQGVIMPDLRIPPAQRDSVRAAPCRVCGEIISIREVQVAGALGAAPQNPAHAATSYSSDWAVVGAAVFVPVGTDRNTHVGAVGTPDMAQRFSANGHEVTVRMDDGARHVLQRRDGGRFRIGQRVSLSGGLLEPM